MDPATRVRELVEPVLAADGLELVDVQFASGTLQVFVDRPGGIDLDTISAVSTSVSRLLDQHDPVPGGRYTLEVSSPGLERPLRRPDHFRRFVGSTVAVRTHPDVEGERRVEGSLESADDEGVVVAGRRLRYDEIDRARTVFAWGAAPKPASRPAKGKVTRTAGKRAVS
ncbi:MAG: ribosome maturation factor RimP [Acidimicrobiales bacterium]